MTFSHSSDATSNISTSLKSLSQKVVQKSPPPIFGGLVTKNTTGGRGFFFLCHTNVLPCTKARKCCVSSLHKCSLFSSNWPKFTNSLFPILALIVCGNWTPKGLQTDVNGLFAILGTPVLVILPLVVVRLVLVPVKRVTNCVKFPWEINPCGKPVPDVFTVDTFVTFPVLVRVLIHTSGHWHYIRMWNKPPWQTYSQLTC